MGVPAPITSERLFSTIDDFLTSLQDTSSDKFTSQWAQLHDSAIAGYENGTMDQETSALAIDVAGCIQQLCEAFMLQNQIEDAFDPHDFPVNSALEDQPHTAPTSPEPEPQISSSPYVRDAFEWLLENLHNPYPSPAQRDAISFKSGASRKSIDSWFIDVRKRIGWNIVRKKYFKERKEMIAAACIFIRGDEPDTTDKKQLDYPADLGIAFAEIRGKALDLYGNDKEASHLVQKLAGQVKTLTPELQEELAKERREEKLKRRRVAHKRQLSSSSSEESVVAPVAGKRRRSDDDESDSSPRKRTRDEEPSEGSTPAAPSLETSTTVDEAPTPSTSTSSPAPSTSSQAEPGSKKRRLVSDSDATPRAAKRLRPAYPIGRAASVPITLPAPQFPVENWFSQTQPLPAVDQWPEDKFNFTFGTTDYYSDLETLLSDGSEVGSPNGTGPSTPASQESLQLGIAPSETTLPSYYNPVKDVDLGINLNIEELLNNLSNPAMGMGMGIGIVDPSASHLPDTFSGAQNTLPDIGLEFMNFPLDWSTDLNSAAGMDGCGISLSGFETHEQEYLRLPQVA